MANWLWQFQDPVIPFQLSGMILMYLRNFREEQSAWLKGWTISSCDERVQKVYLPSLSKKTSKSNLITVSEKIRWELPFELPLQFSNQQKTVNGSQHIEANYETGLALMHSSRKNSGKIAKYFHFYIKLKKKVNEIM